MHLATAPEIDALRLELRGYYARLLTPAVIAELDREGERGGPVRSRLLRRMGTDGWLGIGWPAEFGGQGRGADAQFAFFDESFRAGAPLPMVTLTTVGPTLMALGSPEQKARFLPGILAGEIVFAIGYTEPEAGTDLASLRTKAVRDGDEWVIAGEKVFTSGADGADYIWLACRTDPGAAKHQGISVIVVPTSAQGFSVTPIDTVGDVSTTTTYYDNVRVPRANLVGEENGGWRIITSQLNHERVGLAAIGGVCQESYDETVRWAASHARAGGSRVIDDPWVQIRLAEAYARLSALRLVNLRLVGDVAAGELNPGDASAAKVLGSETAVDVYRILLEVVGARALVHGNDGSFYGRLERANRMAQINTFGGGVNEVQREIIATARLGMQRRPR